MRFTVMLFLVLSAFAQAQTINFTTDVTSGNGSVTPTLSWDTTPPADDCVASGAWSGSRASSGSQVQPAITQSATYNLSCTWIDNDADLSWTPPTTNTDGTSLTDLTGYSIYYGQAQGGPYPDGVDVTDPTATSFTVQPLSQGVWYFVATARNSFDVESIISDEASAVVGDDTSQEAVGITVNPEPMPPTNLIAF